MATPNLIAVPSPKPISHNFFTFQDNLGTQRPRAWDRAPKSPFANRRRGRKVWKRYELRSTETTVEEPGTALGLLGSEELGHDDQPSLNVSRPIKRLCLKQSENGGDGVGVHASHYFTTLRDRAPGTPKRKYTSRRSLKPDRVRPRIAFTFGGTENLETGSTSLPAEEKVVEDPLQSVKGPSLEDVDDLSQRADLGIKSSTAEASSPAVAGHERPDRQKMPREANTQRHTNTGEASENTIFANVDYFSRIWKRDHTQNDDNTAKIHEEDLVSPSTPDGTKWYAENPESDQKSATASPSGPENIDLVIPIETSSEENTIQTAAVNATPYSPLPQESEEASILTSIHAEAIETSNSSSFNHSTVVKFEWPDESASSVEPRAAEGLVQPVCLELVTKLIEEKIMGSEYPSIDIVGIELDNLEVKAAQENDVDSTPQEFIQSEAGDNSPQAPPLEDPTTPEKQLKVQDERFEDVYQDMGITKVSMNDKNNETTAGFSADYLQAQSPTHNTHQITQNIDHAGMIQTKRSSSPRAEVVPEGRTRSGARFSDDTNMLKEFLSRTQARKLAQDLSSSMAVPGLVESPRRSPRKALIERSGNSPSTHKRGDIANRPGTPPGQGKLAALGFDDMDQLMAEPTSCRRSTRTRSPAPSKTASGAPSFIPVRRADGTDPIVLQKSVAQEVATVTRANTRRNKGQAKTPNLTLQNLPAEASDAMLLARLGSEAAKSVGWDEKLVYFQDVAESTAGTVEKRPRVRRLRGLGAVNGTPAPKKMMATDVGNSYGTPAPKRRGKIRL